MTGLSFRVATPADAAAIVPIVNGAYRGADGRHGWTSEHELVAGARTDPERLAAALAAPGSVVLVAERDGRVVGSVHLTVGEDGACELGMLSVAVAEQATGVGRALVAEAERYAREVLGARTMTMHVISVRAELLAWYERRGYRRTGVLEPFVPSGGQRFVRDVLVFERLEKPLR